ncbi:MAG: aminopeptidase P family protein [Lachnospiraceae bacterium]
MQNQQQRRLDALRKKMAEHQIEIYIVPTADDHASEYVSAHFKEREYITGFTGSAGTAVVTKTQAGLWTDGRYFIQAAQQLKDSGVTLYRMGEEGVPTVEQFVEMHLSDGGCIGFDGRTMNSLDGETFQKISEKKHGRLETKWDLVDEIWQNRPTFSEKKAWVLEETYAGESLQSKVARVRGGMKEQGAQVHLLASLYDIAWLLNLRGDDISHVPVILSFVLLTQTKCQFFVRESVLTDEVRQYLEKNQVEICPYEEVYPAVATLKETTVLLDKSSVNYALTSSLDDTVCVLASENPSYRMKAVKNETELQNTRLAHIKDGVAMTKFMYWLKTHVGKELISERSAAEKLEQLRKEQEHFFDVSFDTISAYGAHAAMMHYQATPESDCYLKGESFLLVDSGGHYLEGTTDVTRTFALGDLTRLEKQHFTAVCRANLRLADAKFLYGCSGLNLDILARGPLWDLGIDYKCGTGHGVGHLLNVHEGPNGFRWRIVPERNDSGVLEEGMITTDEPGVYIEGSHGIRTENELICKKAEKNEYGQFMEFETITYVPIDLDAIDPDQMDASERALLNTYHQKVYETVSPYLNAEETAWLKQYTRAI